MYSGRNADAAVLSEDDGRRYFVRPHERTMPFGCVVRLSACEGSGELIPAYAQRVPGRPPIVGSGAVCAVTYVSPPHSIAWTGID